ncbi:PPIL2 isoform 9, partial [Pongo abelii]
MGKRQHQKDKIDRFSLCCPSCSPTRGLEQSSCLGLPNCWDYRYITCAEYTHFYGGKKPDLPQTNFRRLPFDHCSLSLQPFVYPVCTPDGVVFDLLNIVPWLKKYGTNPSNGEKLDGRSLIKLNFSKNSEGKYHCPVLFTVFTNNTHIVAVRTTGNVYAYE